MNVELLNKIKSIDVIALKYLDDEQINELQNVKHSSFADFDSLYVFCFFKLMLAKKGVKETIERLGLIRPQINELLYIEIASYIYLSVGEYELQLKSLELARELTFGWVERAKVKSNIALGHIDVALEMTNKLVEISSANYDFAMSVYWQLNEWERLHSLSRKCDSQYLSELSGYCIDIGNECCDEKLKLYSLFNFYTINQIELQKKLFSSSRMELIPSIGIQSDRLTTKSLELLGGKGQKGIVGASLSHLKIIEDIAHRDDYALVTESDAFLSRLCHDTKFLDNANGKYDFVLCANRHNVLNEECRDFDGIENFHFNGRASGFDGYFITNGCAQEVMNAFDGKPHNEHIDGKIIHWLATNGFRIGVTKHPIFSQGFCSTFSTRARVELFN
ncbi:hypothetical protein [Shewanella sp. NIFS-20-20]|uniref:hypothetical protein n=1 Tax=Shewanella sp. NIFS-20-20 TaxID=2853806 RepID=UPI001C47968C|nr:hypothetical protein [Shewanella sp. NIFS-20-20]MBV7316768.1 hypothetical protein [Shewanella sp. NIFS-20-20]